MEQRVLTTFKGVIRLRKIALLAVAGLVLGMLGTAYAKPKAVWTDATGDAHLGDVTAAPVFGGAGFDLKGGSIDKKGKNLIFTAQHASLPPFGAVPEAVRFMWAFSVGSEHYRITAKRLNIGKPNPMTQEDTDQIGVVDPAGFFRLEGKCTSTVVGALNAINCSTLGYLKGTWDAGKAAISIQIPMKMIKAKPGSKVGPGGGDAIAICSICWVTHAAERSLDATIIDDAAQTKVYKVPR
jgi:hypothetical protein